MVVPTSKPNFPQQPPIKPIGPPPPLAVAPFDAAQAKAHQEAWAKHLGTTVETTNSVGQKMVLIPPGEFMMGSSDADIALALKIAEEIKADPRIKDRIQNAERPQHKVVITKPFLMSSTEVTIRQFKKFVEASKYVTEAEQYGFGNSAEKVLSDKVAEKDRGRNWRAPGYDVTDDSPAAQITWNDAVAYCQWLSTQEKAVYRLPTEAEWEYACRAGTTTQYSFGDDYNELPKYGWRNKNAGGKSHPVGTLLANPFGLFDMHGNMYEWCGDYVDEKWYASSPPNDPNGPSVGSNRVLRGGAWNYHASYCRSAYRDNHTPSNRTDYYGFRIVRELSAPATTASITPQPAAPAASSSKLFMHDPVFPQWMAQVQGMPAEQQLEAVRKKLKELNPGFDGKLSGPNNAGSPKIESGFVTDVSLEPYEVTDLSPIRAFQKLRDFNCGGKGVKGRGKVRDLSPLAGLPLHSLRLYTTSVSDLKPLRGMELGYLECSDTAVADLTPLAGMPLGQLYLSKTATVDLAPLRTCARLTLLRITSTKVSADEVAALQKALPNCKIEWDDPAKVLPRSTASGTK